MTEFERKWCFRVFDSGRQYECWRIGDDMFYNPKGPSEIIYHKNGLRETTKYLQMYEYHRADGPAYEERDGENSFFEDKFWLFGVRLTFSKWIQIVKDDLTTEQYEDLVEKYGKV